MGMERKRAHPFTVLIPWWDTRGLAERSKGTRAAVTRLLFDLHALSCDTCSIGTQGSEREREREERERERERWIDGWKKDTKQRKGGRKEGRKGYNKP